MERERVSTRRGEEIYRITHTHTPAPASIPFSLPDSGYGAAECYLSLRFMAGQELGEVTGLHVLCDHAEGVAADTHGQQTDDVGVLQT